MNEAQNGIKILFHCILYEQFNCQQKTKFTLKFVNMLYFKPIAYFHGSKGIQTNEVQQYLPVTLQYHVQGVNCYSDYSYMLPLFP